LTNNNRSEISQRSEISLDTALLLPPTGSGVRYSLL